MSKIERGRKYIAEEMNPRINELESEIKRKIKALSELKRKREQILLHMDSSIRSIPRGRRVHISRSHLARAVSAIMSTTDPMGMSEIVEGVRSVIGDVPGLYGRIQQRFHRWLKYDVMIRKIGRNQYVLQEVDNGEVDG